MTAFNSAQLAIFVVLSPLAIYLLFKHGRQGFLGWLYLFAFCSLRVVGAALSLHPKEGSSTGSIISNIGLSPLLIAVSGILHEARVYRNKSLNTKLEWVLVLLYHMKVLAGLGLIAAGFSAFSSTSTPKHSDVVLVKVGIIILVISWITLCLWSLFSLVPSQKTPSALTYISGSKLLYGVLFALPFEGVRLFYSVVSIFAPSQALNPESGDIGFKVGLSLIPELLVVLALELSGFMTGDVTKYDRRDTGRDTSRDAYV